MSGWCVFALLVFRIPGIEYVGVGCAFISTQRASVKGIVGGVRGRSAREQLENADCNPSPGKYVLHNREQNMALCVPGCVFGSADVVFDFGILVEARCAPEGVVHTRLSGGSGFASTNFQLGFKPCSDE